MTAGEGLWFGNIWLLLRFELGLVPCSPVFSTLICTQGVCLGTDAPLGLRASEAREDLLPQHLPLTKTM